MKKYILEFKIPDHMVITSGRVADIATRIRELTNDQIIDCLAVLIHEIEHKQPDLVIDATPAEFDAVRDERRIKRRKGPVAKKTPVKGKRTTKPRQKSKARSAGRR